MTEKERLKEAFDAGVEYWSWVQTDEPMLHKPNSFEEWYEKKITFYQPLYELILEMTQIKLTNQEMDKIIKVVQKLNEVK